MLRISRENKQFKQIVIFTIAFVLLFSSVSALFFYRTPKEYVSANDCGDVFSSIAPWITQRVNENKSVYVQVANETGVPWEMIAAVHYREFNLQVSNPNNGQGIYQLYSSGRYFPPGPVDRNGFVDQTRLAANFLQEKAAYTTRTPIVNPRKLTANEQDINLIKSTLFSYNGRASVYADQATKYDFDRTNQPFEGSPYVMNKFDCKRKAMGLITRDNGPLDGTDTRLGAFTLFARLKGDNYWNNLQVSNIPGCHEATGTTVSCVWRLYNPGARHYTYTTSYSERNKMIAMGYLYQGVSFYGRNTAASRVQGQIPIYQLQTGAGGSFLTADWNEYSILKAAGWKDLGVTFFANPAGTNTGYPVYRLYNAALGSHVWAADDKQIQTLKAQGYASEGVAFNQISTVRQESPAPAGQQVVYRFGSMPGNRHFWTTDIYERDSMIRSGYVYEGVAWRAHIGTTSAPVYRLYSPTMRKHLFTTDIHERNALDATSSWTAEGIAWYANPQTSGAPVFRLYAHYNAEHFYTTDAYERDSLSRSGVFQYEGTAWRQP